MSEKDTIQLWAVCIVCVCVCARACMRARVCNWKNTEWSTSETRLIVLVLKAQIPKITKFLPIN